MKKLITLTIILSLISLGTNAQNVEYFKAFQRNQEYVKGENTWKGIKIDSQGNIYQLINLPYAQSFEDVSYSTGRLLIKKDKDGNTLWSKHSVASGEAFVLDDDDNIIVIGHKVIPSTDGQLTEAVLNSVKYNGNTGDVIWEEGPSTYVLNHADPAIDVYRRVRVRNAVRSSVGNIYLIANEDVGPYAEVMLIQLDSSGKFQFNKPVTHDGTGQLALSFGGSNEPKICLGTNDDLFISVTSSGYVPSSISGTGIVCLDSDGNFKWYKKITEKYDNSLTDNTVSDLLFNNGSLYIAGMAPRENLLADELDQQFNNTIGGYVAKISPNNGDVIWLKVPEKRNPSDLSLSKVDMQKLAVLSDGTFAVAGNIGQVNKTDSVWFFDRHMETPIYVYGFFEFAQSYSVIINFDSNGNYIKRLQSESGTGNFSGMYGVEDNKLWFNGLYQDDGTQYVRRYTFTGMSLPVTYRNKTYSRDFFLGRIDFDATPAIKPESPTNLTATFSDNPKEITLSWQDNSNNEDGFIVEMRRLKGGGGTWLTVDTLSANTTEKTYTDSEFMRLVKLMNNAKEDLEIYTDYQFRVISFNEVRGNATVYSNEVQISPYPALSYPVLNITATEGGFNLTWTDTNTSKLGFVLQAYSNITFKYETIATLDATINSYTFDPSNISILENLRPNHKLEEGENVCFQITVFSSYAELTSMSSWDKPSCVPYQASTAVSYMNTPSFTVYPNPAKDYIKIDKVEPQSVISLMSSSGQVIYTELSNSGKTSIDTSNLANGLYFIQIKNKGIISVERVIVMK